MLLPFAQMMPGMEWIPLMVLSVGGGLTAGVLGILVGLAVSKSRFAFWAGVVASTSGAGSPLFFLVVAGRHLVPGAYALLAVPLLAGLPALLLSFRPSLRLLGEVEEDSGQAP